MSALLSLTLEYPGAVDAGCAVVILSGAGVLFFTVGPGRPKWKI